MTREEEIKDTLNCAGYEDLAERVVSGLEEAIIGIITNGCTDALAYDEAKVPVDMLELIPGEDYIVELLDEDKAIEALGNPVVFGNNGENEYKGAIIGITNGHLLYDYDLIAEAKMRDNDKEVVVDGITIGPMTYEDAVEDIDYNIIRAMPYFPEGPRILMNRYMFED